jgi:TRAP-type C4-dicarboxylate transport system permease small subunit
MAAESAGGPPESGGRIDGLRRIVRSVAWLLRASLIAASAVMLACIVIQVVMRYVFGQTPSWSEEVAILMFAWITLGGLALGIHEGFHVRLTLALDPLPRVGRLWAERGIDLIAGVFGACLVWSGLRFVDFTRGSVSAAIAYPIELLHGMAPFAGALVCLFTLERVVAGAAGGSVAAGRGGARPAGATPPP